MKYIAFEGTYNEQVFNSEKHTITFTSPEATKKAISRVYDVDIQLETGTWKELPE